MTRSLELASRLAKGATQSLALIKYLVHKSLSMEFEEALDLAHVAQKQVRKTEDRKEAVQAFLEKRPAGAEGAVGFGRGWGDWDLAGRETEPSY